MKKTLLIVLAGLLLAACTQKADKVTYNDLAHHRFILKSFNGEAIPAVNSDKQPRIEFNEGGNISGAVCNLYHGNATFEGGKLTANAVSTKMFCFSEVLNRAESAFFKALSEGADTSLTGNNLTITHDGNVFEFELKDYVK